MGHSQVTARIVWVQFLIFEMLAIFNSHGVKPIMECNWYLLFLFDYLVIQKLSVSEDVFVGRSLYSHCNGTVCS